MIASIARVVAALFRWRKRLLLRFVATSVGRALTSMAVIFFIREFLSGAVDDRTGFASLVAGGFGETAVLWISAGLLLVMYLGGALFYYDNQIVVQRLIKVVELGFMDRLLRHLMTLSVPYTERHSHGEMIQTFRTDITQLRLVVQAFANMLLESVVVVGLMAMATWISPLLAIWVLLALPAITFPIFLLSKRLRMRSYTVRKTSYLLFDMILEVLGGMRVIKTLRGEEIQARMAREKGGTFFDEVIQMTRLQALGRVGMESLAGLSVVVVVLIGGFQVLEGKLSWPSLLAFVMAVRVMHTPLNLIHKQFVQAQSWHASVWRIADFLATRPQVVDLPDARPLRSAPDLITCRDISFSYNGKKVLNGISFAVRRGETIGIVGPSGAGKSTLLNLLIRLYDPTEGAIQFDGVDLREIRLDDLYEKVAIVAQEPFLFAASVRENIRCGRPGADDREIEQAARTACIHEEILDLPAGYETLIGVGGRKLSRGQAQRINVARAFLKNPPILLLDEATSSLDSVAEANVQRAIDELSRARTSLVVAHRLSTLQNADHLLVLERGRQAGFGTHDELLLECELYASLWRSQSLGTDGKSQAGAPFAGSPEA